MPTRSMRSTAEMSRVDWIPHLIRAVPALVLVSPLFLLALYWAGENEGARTVVVLAIALGFTWSFYKVPVRLRERRLLQWGLLQIVSWVFPFIIAGIAAYAVFISSVGESLAGGPVFIDWHSFSPSLAASLEVSVPGAMHEGTAIWMKMWLVAVILVTPLWLADFWVENPAGDAATTGRYRTLHGRAAMGAIALPYLRAIRAALIAVLVTATIIVITSWALLFDARMASVCVNVLATSVTQTTDDTVADSAQGCLELDWLRDTVSANMAVVALVSAVFSLVIARIRRTVNRLADENATAMARLGQSQTADRGPGDSEKKQEASIDDKAGHGKY